MYDHQQEIYICDICKDREATIGPELVVAGTFQFGFYRVVFDKDVCPNCFLKNEEENFAQLRRETKFAVVGSKGDKILPRRIPRTRYGYISECLNVAKSRIAEAKALSIRIQGDGEGDDE